MNKPGKFFCLLAAAFGVAALPLLSQTSPNRKPSFEVVSIKPSAPLGAGPVRVGGGARGDRYTMSNATLRMLLQQGYTRPGTPAGIREGACRSSRH
jgi:hypothetical protein